MQSAMTYPPGPRSRYPLQNFLAFRRNILAFLTEMASHGDLSHFRVRGFDIYLANHPDLIREVLVTQDRAFKKSRGLQFARRLLGNGLLTSEGEFHRRQRKLAQPAFHYQRMAGYARTMSAYAADVSRRWQDGQPVDMAREMMRLTLAIAGKTLFNADVEGEADEIGAALGEAMEQFTRTSSPLYPLLERLPLPANRRYERAQNRLDETIYRMIREHRQSGDVGDLLSMLLAAQEESGADAGMSDEQLRDEAMTIFLAGHETTALALAWTWYLLSQNPEVESALHAELAQVLGGRAPAFDDIPALPYTRMVFAETMRLYPPAYVVGRQALQAVSIGGYHIPEGATILVSQYVMHHDARYFPDPYRYDPLRFTPEAEAQRPKFAYFPFGGGSRVCIGESFAWTEGILALATLAQGWRARLQPGYPVELLPVITLRPKHGIGMVLEKR